jgi:hypothetical protein
VQTKAQLGRLAGHFGYTITSGHGRRTRNPSTPRLSRQLQTARIRALQGKIRKKADCAAWSAVQGYCVSTVIRTLVERVTEPVLERFDPGHDLVFGQRRALVHGFVHTCFPRTSTEPSDFVVRARHRVETPVTDASKRR